MGGLPRGRVTFAFTDVVGSTRAFTEHGDAYVEAIQALQALVAEEAARHGGVVVKTEGDGTFLAFATAGGALDGLTAIVGEAYGAVGLALRLRAGAHTGDAEPIGDDYFALAVHVAARVSSAAGGGQVLVSQAVVDDAGATRGATRGEMLGAYDLKDIAEPVVLWRMAGDATPPRAPSTRRTNVAEPHTSFVGRDAEVAELAAAFERPGLLTVVGPGGLGKTRLVSEVALRQAEILPAGAWLVELVPVHDPAEVPDCVGRVLGIVGASDTAALVEELRRRGHLLLVLDNCEHLIDACADLATSLLDGCPELRLVCTSREPLTVDRERVLRLAPLPTDGAAEALFLDRAEAAGGPLAPADLAAVSEVCRHLDGLPLALELAAARTSSVPIANLADALSAGDIELRRRGGEERQRSLEALVEWSLRLLEDGERTALLALAVFPGRFSGPMAESVLRAVPDARRGAAGELTRRSLLDLDGDHYRMLTTTRGVVRRALLAEPDLHEVAMDALVGWAQARAEDRDAFDTLTLDEVHALHTVLDWMLQRERAGGGLVMDRVARWELTHNRSAASRDLATRALARPHPVTPDELLLHVAACRLLSGLAGAHGLGLEHTARLVETARGLDDLEVRAKTLRLHAGLLDRAGRHDEAAPLLLEVLTMSEDHPHIEGLQAVIDLGVNAHLAGDLELAEQYYRHGLEVIGRRDVNRALVMGNLGEVLLDADRLDEATDHLRAALAAAVGRPHISAWITGLLVEAEARRGNGEVALALAANAAAELSRVLEDDPSIAYVLDRMHAALGALTPDPV